MFHMEDSPQASEVRFAEEYHNIVRKLNQQQSTTEHHHHRARTPSGKQTAANLGGKPSLGAMANLASAGMASVSVGTAVDKVYYFFSALQWLVNFISRVILHRSVDPCPTL